MHPESLDFPCAAVLYTLMRLAEQQSNEEPPLQFQDLAHPLGLAPATLQLVVDGLKSGGFVVEVPSSKGSKAGAECTWCERRMIKLADALAAVTAGDNANLADPRVAAVMQRIASAQRQVLESMTLADLMRVQPAYGHRADIHGAEARIAASSSVFKFPASNILSLTT